MGTSGFSVADQRQIRARQLNRYLVPVAIGTLAAVLPLVLSYRNRAFNDTVLDRVAPAVAVHPEVVVVGFDSRRRAGLHLREDLDDATSLAGVIQLAREGGARMIVLVGANPSPSRLQLEWQGLVDVVNRGEDVVVTLDYLTVEPSTDGPTMAAASFRSPALADHAGAVVAGWPDAASTDGGRLLPAVVTVSAIPPPGEIFLHEEVDQPRTALLASLPLVQLLARSSQPAGVSLASSAVYVGSLRLPTESGHRMRVSYAPGLRPGGPAVLDVSQVMQPDFDVRRLRNAVVLVGWVSESDGRTVPTPLGNLPEVLAHANAVNTTLLAAYREPLDRWLMVLVTASSATLATAAWWCLRARSALLVSALSIGAAIALARLAADVGILVDVVAVAGAILLAAGLAAAAKLAVEMGRRRRVSQLFAGYVPEPVAQQLMAERGNEVPVSGERVEGTVLFCDLRGFTPLSLELPPPEVRELLEVFYRWSSGILMHHGGTVLQYVGDEVFAVFGAPVAQVDHTARGYAAVNDLLGGEEDLQRLLAEAGVPSVRFGVGLHAGDLVAAHVTDGKRRQYTVIGDAVNVAARLCSNALPGEALVSEVAARDVGLEWALIPYVLKGRGEVRAVRVSRTGPVDPRALASRGAAARA